MRLYLDDDSAQLLLARLLRNAKHDVQIPADVGLVGRQDALHLRHAIQQDRVLLSRNYQDFTFLHDLILEAQGRYPGILIVRRDNDRRRDLAAGGIVSAITKLLASN